jgi:predicted AAA+ superfamily ATPase
VSSPLATAKDYIHRVLDEELDALLPSLPAIAIEGAKGVGKTATAAKRATSIRALDDPAFLDVVRADPHRLVEGAGTVLIDEWQRFPQSWDQVRRAVDAGAPPSRYLLTGSATPHDPGTHSGAGRIVRLRMRPMTLFERGPEKRSISLRTLLGGGRPALSGTTAKTVADYTAEICASGFPALRLLPDRARRAQLDGYVTGIIDRDFPELGRVVRNPAALRRWMTAYAAATATNASYDRIRDAATAGEDDKPAKTTTGPYRDILERLWVLDPLPAWLPTRSALSRLTVAPKHHLADPALAVRLLGMDANALLDAQQPSVTVARDTTMLAQLFESLVALDVRVYAQAAEARASHLRTHSGEREVDLIVERGDGRIVAVEVKLARTVDAADVRHLLWLRDKMGDDLLDAVVVTTGPEAYRRADGIGIVPAALLGP